MSAEDAALGFLIGYKFPTKGLGGPDFAGELAAMRKKLDDASIKAVAESAQHLAVTDCINELVGELANTKAGKPVVKRHSDIVDGAPARSEDFIDTANSHLRRLSGGALQFSDESVRAIKEVGVDIGRVVNTEYMTPKAVRVKKPK
jgi:hypothetical protein